MAIAKYTTRAEALINSKEEYVRISSIMAECEPENVLIVGCKLTEDDARAKVADFLANEKLPTDRGVNGKLAQALRNAATPTVRKEYYSVIASYFHISEVEYDYSYRLNGNVIDMSPKRVGANMDFIAAVETLDGRYYQTLMGKRTPMNMWDDLLESECVEDFEEGFLAHKMFPEDSERESKESMRLLNTQLKARMNELVQEQLGKARRLENVNIIDKVYTYVERVLAAPFYVFNYDLGKQVVTITVDAYSGVVSTPVVNNPLSYALFAKVGEAPSFSIPMCVICGVVIPVFGAVIYGAGHILKKAKYEKAQRKDVPKFTLEEMKALL
jgi:hypothetical protein